MSAFEIPAEEAMRFWGQIPEPVNWRTRSFEDERAIAELHERLRSLGALHRDILRAVALVDERKTWRDDGARDMPEWLAAEHGISKTEARLWVRASHALEALPLLSEALESGRLCLQKTVHLARFATPETERDLIRWARRVTLPTVRDRADAETRRDIDEVRDKQRARWADWRIEDGWYFFDAGLPAQQGAAVAKALDRAARKIPVSPEDAPHIDEAEKRERYTRKQRRADALVALASAHIAEDADPDRATVVVHAELSALMGGAGSCYIEGGPALHPDVAQLLACDARVEFVRYDKSGEITGIDPAKRNPSPALRRAVAHRDHHTCVYPGCEMRAYLRPHHIAWWHFIHKTNPRNLVMLCPTHHDLVHVYGWRVELDREGRAIWFRPDGSLYDPGGEPAPRGPTEQHELPDRSKVPSGSAIF